GGDGGSRALPDEHGRGRHSLLLQRRHPPPHTHSPYTTLFRSLLALVVHEQMEQTLRLTVRQRLEQHGVHHAEHRAVRSGTYRKRDRKSTRLNSSHVKFSYAVFCSQ